jgi:diacylglycerol kinase (ATP)
VDDCPVTRAGLIVNPRSGKSSGKGLALAGMLRQTGNVSIKIIDRFDMIEGLVGELAAEGVSDLFISSGDGTIQAIQTILAERRPRLSSQVIGGPG